MPWLTALENVTIAATQGVIRRTARQARAAARACLEQVGVADAMDQRPGELSLGTQQCVSLARALVVEPRFLLLDEPFSMLDSLTRFELQDILLRVWEASGRTVVMVTHDIDEALYLADRLILMTDGPAATVAMSSRCRFRDRGSVRPCSRIPAYYASRTARDRFPRAPRALHAADSARSAADRSGSHPAA
jgi:ABC-type nitrate/sulfonate/bicarbonate transport system ATPase subunit